MAADTHDTAIRQAIELLVAKSYEQAGDILADVLAATPDCAEAIFLTGLLAYRHRDQGLAIQLMEKALEIDPNCREYADALGVVKTRLGQLADGLYYAKLSTALDPHPRLAGLLPRDMSSYFDALSQVGGSQHYLLGLTAFLRGNHDEAIAECEAELRIDGNRVDVMLLLARALLAVAQPAPALSHLRSAVHLEPTNAELHLALGQALIALGQHADARASLATAWALGDERGLRAKVLGQIQYLPDAYDDWILDVTAQWERLYVTEASTRGLPNRRPVFDGIYLGVLADGSSAGIAGDFLLALGDSNLFKKATLYQLTRTEDPVTRRLRDMVMRWHDAYDLDDMTLGRMILGDQVTVLLDFTGATENRRGRLFPDGQGPIVIRAQGFPLLDMAGTADAVLSCPALAEIDAAQAGRHRCLTLPHSLLAFAMPPRAVMSPPPLKANGFVTFGAVADMALVSADLVRLWAETLRAVPGSRLLLGAPSGVSTAAQDRLGDLLANFGLLHRVDILQAADHEDPIQALLIASDLLLDSYPVSAVTVVPMALAMGVPVVTLKGRRRNSAMGAVILEGAACAQWIATTPEDYVAKASSMAQDPAGLAALRGELSAHVAGAPLFNPAGLVQQFQIAVAGLMASRFGT